jgi:lipoate synthase
MKLTKDILEILKDLVEIAVLILTLGKLIPSKKTKPKRKKKK